MTTVNLNKNNNNRLLVVAIILIIAYVIVFCSSCATEQSCLRERDAYKHKKAVNRDLNNNFGHRY